MAPPYTEKQLRPLTYPTGVNLTLGVLFDPSPVFSVAVTTRRFRYMFNIGPFISIVVCVSPVLVPNFGHPLQLSVFTGLFTTIMLEILLKLGKLGPPRPVIPTTRHRSFKLLRSLKTCFGSLYGMRRKTSIRDRATYLTAVLFMQMTPINLIKIAPLPTPTLYVRLTSVTSLRPR